MPQSDRHAEQAVAQPLLQLRGLSKTFPGTRALNRVDLDVRAGEVLALVGANGSGKSTVIKVLAGYHRADPGSSGSFDGEDLPLTGAGDAAHDRIRFVHQDLGLVLELSAMDNLALKHGYAGTRLGRIPWRRQARETRAILGRLGLGPEFDIAQPLARATPVERTIVAIAAALHGWDERQGLLVLDEPTAVLPPGEAARLFEIVAQVRRRGASVLYVSHRLDELFHIADRVAVLRGGELVDVLEIARTTAHELAELMVGDEVDPDYRAEVHADAGKPVALAVRDLRGKYLRGASFTLRAGEVVGIAGLPGSGREELPFAISGALGTHVTGEIRIPGIKDAWTPVNRLRGLTLPLVPDDRTKHGVVAQFSVRENLALSVLSAVSRAGVLSRGREDELVDGWIDRLAIKSAGSNASIATLSGGNQQKVVMARALAIGAPALVLCEPTAGVDIGSRIALYELIAEEARRGMAVVVSSSDVGDLLALCTRLLVLHDGVVVRELDQSSMTETAVLSAMEETAR